MRRSAALLNAKLTVVTTPFLGDGASTSANQKLGASQTTQSNNFAQQVATPESYRLLRQKTQEALYREFPEARGHIEIYDQTANPQTEFTRISHSLNFKSPADRSDFEQQFKADIPKMGASGHAFTFTDHHGQRYGVALGWEPDNFHSNIAIQKAFVHETTHCLDHLLNNAWISQERLGFEGVAEATAIKVSAENGLGRQWGNRVAAAYPQGDESGGFNSEFGPGVYDIYGATPYLLSKASYNEQNSHYDGSIKGWRAAFAAISEIRNKDFPRELQRSFEIMQVAITDVYATNQFDKNGAAHQEWLKKISSLPEYQNFISGDKAINQNTGLQYVQPSFTPESYKNSIALLWKLHKDNPADERVTHLLKAYRDANNVMPNQPLAKIEKELVRSGAIKADMVVAADNAVKVEMTTELASLFRKVEAANTPTTATGTSSKSPQTTSIPKPKAPAAYAPGL